MLFVDIILLLIDIFKSNYIFELSKKIKKTLTTKSLTKFKFMKYYLLKSNFILPLMMSLTSFFINGQTNPQSFYYTGSVQYFTVPAGVYQVTVEAWGGGGKGGSCLSQNGLNVGGGGGGGAYSTKSIAVIPGNTYAVNVGNGATTTANGGDSWFINSTTILAKGGISTGDNVKLGSAGGNALSCIGDLASSGGAGATGIDNVSGGGGGAGAEPGDIGVTPSANDYRGAIALCNGGNGGDGYISLNGDGFAGSFPGGGGGGGRRNNNNGSNSGLGGFGGNGLIIIKWSNSSQPATLTIGPGGVTADLQLWLRADLLDGTNSVSDNTSVSTWYTQGRGSNATKPAAVGAPVYRNNAAYNINFNSVVDFTNNYNSPSQVFTDLSASRQYLKGTSGFYTQDTFVVVIPDATISSSTKSMDVFCGDRLPCQEIDKTGIEYGDLDTRFTNEILSYAFGPSTAYGAAQVSTTTQYSDVGIINPRNNSGNTGMQLFYNGINLTPTEVNSSSHRNVYDSQFWIGRSEGWDGSLDGRVAEIITFSKRKTDVTERAQIETYLALKYGITIGVAGTSQNHLASDGSIVWNSSTNAGYNNNIAGIGRDDSSKLNQKQSKSINSNSIITIGLGTIASTNTANTNAFATDKSYLVWGDNAGNMNDSGTDLNITFGGGNVTTLTDIPNKKWKIVESGGDVGTTKISIATSDLSTLPALAGNDAYVMIVASNEAFTSNVETVFLTTNGTNQEAFYDFDSTKFFTFGVAHESIYSRNLALNGSNDNVKFDDVNNLNTTAFSMMFWLRQKGVNTLSTDGTIVSKYNGTTGYRVYLSSNGKINISWSGGATLTSSVAISNDIWQNIAIIYSSGYIKLYIDGVLDSTISSSAPAANTNIFSLGSEYRGKGNIVNYFKGDLDEFRLWSKALTLTEIRFIMNQEITQNGTVTSGTIIPSTIAKNDVSALNWSDLQAYYSMNSFIGTHINDDSSNSNRGNLLVPNKVIVNVQSSPMPYETTGSGGLWTNSGTWLNGDIQSIPNSTSIVDGTTKIDWNIVKTNHNVTSSGNKTLLGLLVNANTLSATNDTKIEVSHYINLNGKIDLVGKSQFVQTINSELDVTSSGSLERDQQGQAIRHNYNYWSSPVSSLNNTTINHGFSVAGVMKDGTDPNNIQNLQWTTGVNGSPTTPITLSSYWIFKFQNSSNNYANWSSVGQNGTLLAGQGYTMKGCGSAAADQNYTFVGKPNNGTITSTVGPNNLNLCGNPYPSAIDANKFIDDNASSILGTLYMWEHYNTNSTHTTVQYQGGYATYTKTGGTAPVAPAGISGLGSSSKTPKRFIPVGQGFFVTGSATGGTITLNNGQRLFVKEDHATSHTMFKQNNSLVTFNNTAFNNANDNFVEEQFMKLRLGYNSADNYHRQILLGFMNQHATAGFDNGYDGISIENLTNDMYFINGTHKLNISGDGYFNVNNIYPIGVKNAVTGNVTFVIDGKENFEDSQEIYIYDNVTSIYHSIKNQNFQINLPAGTYDTRFSLRFTNGTSLGTIDNNEINQGINVIHTQSNNFINIKNELQEIAVKSASLLNILGQEVMVWKIYNQNQADIQLRIGDLSSGTYIVKVFTDGGNISKKIIIK